MEFASSTCSSGLNKLKIFVGNLPFTATKKTLEDLFDSYGVVNGVNLRSDRATGRPRGFGFVTFESAAAAAAAIKGMHGYLYQGRPLTVRQATNRGEIEEDGGQSVEEVKSKPWLTSPSPKKTGLKAWSQWAGPESRVQSEMTESSSTSQRQADPKGDLQKILQKKVEGAVLSEIIQYATRQSSTEQQQEPSPSPSFTCDLHIRLPGEAERIFSSDTFPSKKAAEKAAATKALEAIVLQQEDSCTGCTS